ncbi:peptidoglycan-binding domain-containing protein [Streptomyces mayonensis]|uniref:peptidoglycan-binding domain-containing protein n=1 Tax=Streptomyces mayonensis TaxID=2750816 RepID=UPI0027E46BC3|nr:peptidoglycan-binding domain-containing protein [Streptomyces sp. A108]
MATALVSALLGGAAAAGTGAASAAEKAVSSPSSAEAVHYCGYDDRRTPPTIARGSKGDTVREAQCLLTDWDYYLGPTGVDGDFGHYTERAVEQFQDDFGVAGGVDGIVGPKTWDALRTYSAHKGARLVVLHCGFLVCPARSSADRRLQWLRRAVAWWRLCQSGHLRRGRLPRFGSAGRCGPCAGS